jgi:hypothetical protein
MVSRALPWRLSTLLILAGLVAGAAALAEPQASRLERRRRLAGWTLLMIGLGILAFVGPMRLRLVAVAAAVVPIAIAVASACLRPRAAASLPLLVIAAAMTPSAVVQASRSHIGLEAADNSVAEVYAWARSNAPRTAVFVVPPEWRDFRLNAQRALVVDWWATPLVGADALEHRRRLIDLAGGEIRTLDGLRQAYERMDCEHAMRLAAAYGVTHVVRPRERPLSCGAIVYENARYVIMALGIDDRLGNERPVRNAAADASAIIADARPGER